MASTAVPTYRLLPIVGTWAAPFALYNTLLSMRVVGLRIKTEKYLGDKSSTISTEPDPLEVANRCHQNFLENVPLALTLATLCELNGANRKYLHYGLATLFLLRIAHTEAGMLLKGKFGDNGIGRPIGYFGSQGVLLALGSYAAYLTKGYWGF